MKTTKFTKFMALTATAMLISTSLTYAADSVPAVAKSAVNVRTGPNVSFNKVDTLDRGELVTVLQCQSGWCYVDHDGPDGWVSGNYLGPVPTTGSSGSSSSSSGVNQNAAAAAAFAAILGAVVVGIAASSSSSAPPPPPPPPAPLPYGPDTCVDGFVWRDVIPGDHVCVTPDRRNIAANENAIAGARVDPAGAYGPNTCLPGFVWREAYSGDVVCVSPARRTQVYNENLAGPGNRVNP